MHVSRKLVQCGAFLMAYGVFLSFHDLEACWTQGSEEYDVVTLGLGLLINCVEINAENRYDGRETQCIGRGHVSWQLVHRCHGTWKPVYIYVCTYVCMYVLFKLPIRT